eukprot:5395584-Pleurochrysis_carterae.AAC.1
MFACVLETSACVRDSLSVRAYTFALASGPALFLPSLPIWCFLWLTAPSALRWRPSSSSTCVRRETERVKGEREQELNRRREGHRDCGWGREVVATQPDVQ